VSEPARPGPKPETFPHPWPHQRITEHKAPSDGVPQSECWSDSVPVEPWVTSRWPPNDRSRQRVIRVLAPLPSTNTSRAGESPANRSCQWALCSATSERFCSAACSIFYRSMPACAATDPWSKWERADPSAHLVRPAWHRVVPPQPLQPGFPRGGQQRLAFAQVGLGLERATLLNFCRTRRTAATQTPRNSEMQVQKLFLWPVAGSSPRCHLPGESTGKQLDSVTSPSPCPTRCR
jgi:hypothetical protein